jgi:DNA polymerase-3 subunit gamma/tau
MLFTGQAGIGKTTLARIVAKTLNCNNLGDGYEPCDACPSCLDVKEEKFSRNVYMIDAASNRGVEAIESLKGSIHTIPMYGDRRKIFIFDEAHRLSGTAFDAFLTILEEPPPHCYFFFCTTEGKKVGRAIKSRCLQITLSPLKEPEIATRLAHILDKLRETPVTKDEMKTLMMVADSSFGHMRDAITVLEDLYNMDCLMPDKAREFIPKVDESSLMLCIDWLMGTNPKLLTYVDDMEDENDFNAFFFQMRRVIKNTVFAKLGAETNETEWVQNAAKKNSNRLTVAMLKHLVAVFTFDDAMASSPKDQLFLKLSDYYLTNGPMAPVAKAPPPTTVRFFPTSSNPPNGIAPPAPPAPPPPPKP